MTESDIYVKCLTVQLDELEFLSSAFPTTEEFRNADESLMQEMRVYLQEVQQNANLMPPERLINITLAPTPTHYKAQKYEISFELPHLYPCLEHARVLLHTPALNQSKKLIFKAQLEKYMQSLDREEPHIFLLLSWIQEFVDELLKRESSDIEREATQLKTASERLMDFERLWIYSHHIKASSKRQIILQTAQQLNLSGFSLVGKPGVICVEGLQQHTQEFWREIRALNWQKITLCKQETKLRQSEANEAHFRRFTGFQEFIQSSTEDGSVRDNCINMRTFLAFLTANRSAYMKQELFGLN